MPIRLCSRVLRQRFWPNRRGPAFEADRSRSPTRTSATGVSVRGGPGTAGSRPVLYSNYQSQVHALLRRTALRARDRWPSWLGSGRFDIAATRRLVTTKEQSRYVRNLLAERFHLVVHRESKESRGFNLVIGKNGPKLKQASDADVEAVGKPPAGLAV